MKSKSPRSHSSSLFFLVLPWLITASAIASSDTQPKPHHLPALPNGYEITSDCISPNGNYAIMHARRDKVESGALENPRNYLVTLHPFKTVATLVDRPYIPGMNHGSLDVQWTKDSSTVMISVGAKWGPADVTLLELHQGKIALQTDLLAGISGLIDTYFSKTSPDLYKQNSGFIIIDDGSTWTLTTDGVQVTCAATNDPKESGGGWSGSLKAMWSLKQRNWLNITPVPFNNAQ